MKNQTVFSLDSTEIIDIQKKDNLSVVQLQLKNSQNMNVLSFHEAIKMKCVEVKEIEDNETVNEVILTNISLHHILVLDGDLLKGAKQNRVANTSILIGPMSKVTIPVSCVERGRWHYKSNNYENGSCASFKTSNHIAQKQIRMQKSFDIYDKKIKSNSISNNLNDFKANQQEVWNVVEHNLTDCKVDSASEDYFMIYDNNIAEIEQTSSAFKANDKANGLAYYINGELMGVELFNNSTLYSDYFDKILNSIAIENKIKVNHSSSNVEISDADHYNQIQDVLNDIKNNDSKKITISKGVCLGSEYRKVYEDKGRMKSFYQLSYDDNMIHESILIND